MSRAWAVAGLVGFVAERGYALYAHGFTVGAGIIVGVVILFAFIDGVRGTFAFHELSKTPAVDAQFRCPTTGSPSDIRPYCQCWLLETWSSGVSGSLEPSEAGT
jgi:hypothetical protein